MAVPIRANMALSKISGSALADLLGHWPAADGPLYRLLAARIARLADTGELPAGLRLPPERDLADALSVSRNTVASAYQQLRDEGMAESRQGAGTRIVPHRTTPAAVHRANGFYAGMLESATVDADLSLAAADCAPPVAAALGDPATYLGPDARREVTATTGYFPLGWPGLRTALARHLSGRLGLPTEPSQIVVTTGAQQALDLLIRGDILPGQPAVVEDPTFPGMLDLLQRAGARMVGVPAGRGTDPDRLAAAVRTHRPGLVYLTPTHHNPTGLVMPRADRQRVAAIAAAHPDTLFIDDTTMAELSLEPARGPVPPLATLAPDLPNIVTVGSLSKTYWGGLRTGWIRAAPGVVRRAAAAKAVSDLGSPPYAQAVAAALIDGEHERIMVWRLPRLRDQRDTLHRALSAGLPDWSWTLPPGGLSLWVELPGRADGGAFTQAALRHGVAIVPGRLLSATGQSRNRLRIAYTQPPAQLEDAAARLAAAWDGLPRAALDTWNRRPAGIA